MAKQLTPKSCEEMVHCQDCLLPFRRAVGSHRILCGGCAGRQHIPRHTAGGHHAVGIYRRIKH